MLGLTLTGFAPLGGDPELMYMPIKSELGRALARASPLLERLLRTGTPLVAESHIAGPILPTGCFTGFVTSGPLSGSQCGYICWRWPPQPMPTLEG